MGEIDGDRTDQYLPLSMVRAPAAPALDAAGHRLPHRRTGALFRRGGDRPAGRLHHADDAQFLRELQPRAADLHRHAVHVPGPGRRGRPAAACCAPAPDAELDAAIRAAISRKPKGHDFIIDRRHDGAGGGPAHERDGRVSPPPVAVLARRSETTGPHEGSACRVPTAVPWRRLLLPPPFSARPTIRCPLPYSRQRGGRLPGGELSFSPAPQAA